MNSIVRCLMIGGLVVGGFLGSPLSVNAKRGLTIGEAQTISDKHGKEVILYKESYALVVGVSHYTDWPGLPGVKKDVQEVKAVLEEQGFHVVVKQDLDKIGLDQAFSEFISQYGGDPENRLLFYFAGHGHTLQLAYGGEMGYIVPADAPLPHYGVPAFQNKAIPMQRIQEYALQIQAKHALFLFDSCFSGALFALSRAVPEIISYKTAQPVRQFITSGSAEEKVPDESVFRAQFVRALRGEGDSDQDGYVTGTELGAFLQKTVVNYTHNAQHPQYGTIRNPNLDKGDFVFQLSVTIVVEEQAQTAPSSASALDPEAEMWELVKHSDNISDVRRFLRAFPQGRLTEVAQLKLEQLERQLAPAPLPTATTIPMPTVSKVDQQITQLLEQADAYFARQWYTTPEETNAFDVYQEVLKLDPGNAHASQQIGRIAQFYKSRAEREERQGRTEKAIQYYRKYLKIVPDEEAILDKIDELQTLPSTIVPSTPTPISIVVTPTPRPTSRPPTPTPQPQPRIRLRSEPGKFSENAITTMVQTRGFFDFNRNPHGDFPNTYEAKTLKGDRVVIDHAIGLMWQQAGSSNRMTQGEMQDYVDQLNREQYAGFSDWRLPTIEELASLLEPTEKNGDLYIDPIFDRKQWWCWSADETSGSSGAVWVVYFRSGGVNWCYVDDEYYVRCVRP